MSEQSTAWEVQARLDTISSELALITPSHLTIDCQWLLEVARRALALDSYLVEQYPTAMTDTDWTSFCLVTNARKVHRILHSVPSPTYKEQEREA